MKVAVPVISTLLVAGILIGALMHHHHDPEKSKTFKPSSEKMLTSICKPTHYKDSCFSALYSAADNSSATVNDYVLAVVKAALTEVNNARTSTSKVVVDKEKNQYDYVAVEDCKNMLDYAVDLLNDSIAVVGAAVGHRGLSDRLHDLLSWLTAVHAFQTTCTDNIRDDGYKLAVEDGMVNAKQMTHNAVNVVAEMPEMMKVFDLDVAGAPGSSPAPEPSSKNRRLKALDEGFPYWFGTTERKLVEKIALTPNAVVAKDGSGQFETIMAAVASYPRKFKGRFVIYVKQGVYEEKVVIDRKKPNIFMYGDGIGKTIVTGKLNVVQMNIGTMHTATFANEASDFIARGMTFRNEAGPEGHQAVAFRSVGDRTAAFDCSFEANQDTLYYQNLRQFYKNCKIYGTVDFIFGKGDCVIQDSDIVVRRPLPNQFNTVTADGRDIRRGSNGLVIHHCNIYPDEYLWPQRFDTETYLGRPWSREARVVVMQSTIGDLIRPEGYRIWDGTLNHETCEMYEFENTGPGAETDRRNTKFKRFKVLSVGEAEMYTVAKFLKGAEWLPQTGLPVQMELY